MKIVNQSKHTVLAQRTSVADTFVSRLVGLLNRTSLNPREALIIEGCKSIHMFFMRFAIDAIFVDKNNHVVGIVEDIKPFRISPFFWRARFVVELPVGTIESSHTQVGDLLELSSES